MIGIGTQDSFHLSELDLAVINAMQINPRASWTLIGEVLQVDPVTAARRWERLTRAGAAWVTCQPLGTADTSAALVEIECEPGRNLAVARQLSDDPQAVTIDLTAGGRDLVVTVVAPDLPALSSYLLERAGGFAHVTRVRSHPVVRFHTDASRWRLRSLERGQVRQLTADLGDRTPTDSARQAPTGADWAIATALAADGRASLAELAAAADVSVATARRRLGRLIGAGQIRLRCELARELTGWPISVWFFAETPPSELDDVAAALLPIPEVRAVVSTAGPHNLLVAAWLRRLEDVQRLEAQITRRLSAVTITDRSLVIRPYKLLGRLLDPHGFSTAVVPMDIRPPGPRAGR
ncbi:Lrp/AsnC family transcriptional regulator [Rhodococcus olei]|uniref:Lrp/AsnC family transcriptional regulator n=1 Tax=Rhodococcus olei TaxID=2161675 RepID=A0ABP8NUN0_9NOCA